MGSGITNVDISNFIEKDENSDLKQNFAGVFSMDYTTKFINFEKMIELSKKGKTKKAKYPFAIYNSDDHKKPGTHWWSFIDIYPRNDLFFFDSHGLDGFRYFIVDNDQKIIDEVLYDFSDCKESQSDFKIKLCKLTFDRNVWEKMSSNKKEQLTEVAINFFHLLNEFAKLKKSNIMNIIIVENDLQELTSQTCGIFQLYFYKNLFDPATESGILKHEKLTKKTTETILNEIFTVDADENERRIKIFKQEFM